MISSEIFHQKLQAGQIHDALALVLSDASELDVTTRLTEVATSQSGNSEYLRTKINLLTGEIHNEVGKDLVAESTSYIKLQQLHIDQIVVSHRLVQGYLDRVKAILTVLDPSSLSGASTTPSQPTSDRFNCATLVARLNQVTASPASIRQAESEHVAASSAIDRPDLTQLDDNLTAAMPPQEIGDRIAKNVSKTDSTPIAIAALDEDLDLAIDPDGTIWEEWVEDEDFLSGSLVPPPSSSPHLDLADIPEPQEHWGRRQLHPIEVKPTIVRTTTEFVNSRQWDRFEPEYLDVSTNPQPPMNTASDPRILDRLLTDLDK